MKIIRGWQAFKIVAELFANTAMLMITLPGLCLFLSFASVSFAKKGSEELTRGLEGEKG